MAEEESTEAVRKDLHEFPIESGYYVTGIGGDEWIVRVFKTRSGLFFCKILDSSYSGCKVSACQWTDKWVRITEPDFSW